MADDRGDLRGSLNASGNSSFETGEAVGISTPRVEARGSKFPGFSAGLIRDSECSGEPEKRSTPVELCMKAYGASASSGAPPPQCIEALDRGT
jgi:hypothetical protein